MIKRTVIISNKAYIFHKDQQLHISKEDDEPTVPIEDIGVLILESHQVTITQSALSALMANNVVVIGCDATHHPDGMMTPLAGNVLHTAVLKDQLNASLPFRKQLWQQTVKAKINTRVWTKLLEPYPKKILKANYNPRSVAHGLPRTVGTLPKENLESKLQPAHLFRLRA